MICRILHKVGEKKNAIIYEGAGGGGSTYPTLKTWSSAAMNSSLTPNPKTLWQEGESLQISHNNSSLNNLYLFHHHENDLIKSLFNNNNNVSQTTNLFPMNNVAFSSTKRYKDDKQQLVDHMTNKNSSNIVLINQQTCTSSKKNETMLKSQGNFYDQNAFGMNSDWISSLSAGMEEEIPCNYFNNVVMDNNYPIKIAAESWPLHL